jgi:hypothetical protein
MFAPAAALRKLGIALRAYAPGWRKDVPAVLFLCAAAVCLRQALDPAGFGFGHGFEMVAIAKNLAGQGTFGNPFETAATGPTAVVPPLYPVFLAVLIKILRTPMLVVVAATVGSIVANALGAALMPRLSLIFYGDIVPGVFAAVLWIGTMRVTPQWDVNFTVAGLLLFCLLAATIEPQGRILWSTMKAGVVAGLLTLMNPATILVTFPCFLFLLWRRGLLRRAIRCGALFALVVAMCNAPWAIRNYRIWHAPVLRTNFGMTIYSSNNPCAESSLLENSRSGCYQATHPVASQSEIQLLRTLGEVEYDRRRTADALHWIQANPARFRQLTLARVVEFWFPDPVDPVYTSYGIWIAGALSIPGLILMAKRREPVTLLVLLVWLVYPLMYYVVVSANRYRYPILWTSLLPAGYCLAVLGRRSIVQRIDK